MELRDQLERTLSANYTFERELGGGGMSRVFVATEQSLGRQVVVKVLPTESAGQVSIDRFMREIRLAAGLQQANIVPVLSAGDAGGVPYYTMPFVKGETLRSRIATKGALPITECIAILRDVARALAFAHAEGVVHRDIKPDNILLSGGTAVVTDFGIAKAFAASQKHAGATLTQLGVALGTPAYMAPEQAVGEEVDHRADIYSLGVVGYELLSGTTPFAGRSSQAMLAAHAMEAPHPVTERRADIPTRLARLVMRCLAKEQVERPQTASEVLDDLEAAATPEFERALADGAGTVQQTVARATVRGDSGASARTHRSVAVLPFGNVSSDPENEYFSDGITEDIIAQLSKIAHLKVISRTSTMRYKRADKSLRDIAGELGVGSILEGSVRRAGNRVRIVAQLIDAETNEHLWTDTYDRELTDVFAIQSDVALHVASALRAVLAPEEQARVERKPTESVEAYNHYLLGRYALNKRSSEQLQRAIQCFERAIEEDPTYAAPYAGLADAYTLAAIGYGVAPRDALPRAKAAAVRAIELDDSFADAHTSLGYVRLNYDWDYFAAEREFRRALELNPSSAQAHQWGGHARFYICRWDEGRAMLERALELDPLSVLLTAELAWPHAFQGNVDEAMRCSQRALAMDPDFALAHYNLGQDYDALGRLDASIEEADLAARLSGRASFTLALLGRVRARRGERAEAHAIAVELQERAGSGEVVNHHVAVVLDALEESDAAFEWLERACDAREPMLAWLHVIPLGAFENLRKDARFDALLDRIGMARQMKRYS